MSAAGSMGFCDLLFPRHIRKLGRNLDRSGGCGGSLGHFKVIGTGSAGGLGGFVHVAAPGGDTCLEAMMFGGLFVAGLHVEQGEVGVDQLFMGPEFFGFMAFGDGAGEFTFAVPGHAERQAGVELVGVLGENGFELGDRAVELFRREVEHGIVVPCFEGIGRCIHGRTLWHESAAGASRATTAKPASRPLGTWKPKNAGAWRRPG